MPSSTLKSNVNISLCLSPALTLHIHTNTHTITHTSLLSSLQDDPRLFDVNVKDRVDGFVAAAQDQAKHYRTDHIMFTMGSDFNVRILNVYIYVYL